MHGLMRAADHLLLARVNEVAAQVHVGCQAGDAEGHPCQSLVEVRDLGLGYQQKQ